MFGNKGGMDIGKLLKEAGGFQKEMARVQAELNERVVEGTAGGGIVKAYVNGGLELLSVKIAPEAVNPKEVDILEDLVTAATKQAFQKANDMVKEEMKKITPAGLPGMF
ncbi:MAG: YbaB/EbfC family nucleoid-associated protein [Candidatus Brocadiia bacterium]